MRGLVIALAASAAVLAGCSDKEEVQVPPTETTIVTPAPVVTTPAPAEVPAATGDTTTVVTPAADAAMDSEKTESK